MESHGYCMALSGGLMMPSSQFHQQNHIGQVDEQTGV